MRDKFNLPLQRSNSAPMDSCKTILASYPINKVNWNHIMPLKWAILFKDLSFPLAAKQTVPVGFRLLELLFTPWNAINGLFPVHWEWWRCSQSALKAWKNWVVINIQFACVWGGRQRCKCAEPHVAPIVYLRNAAARMHSWTQFLSQKGLPRDPLLWSQCTT